MVARHGESVGREPGTARNKEAASEYDDMRTSRASQVAPAAALSTDAVTASVERASRTRSLQERNQRTEAAGVRRFEQCMPRGGALLADEATKSADLDRHPWPTSRLERPRVETD